MKTKKSIPEKNSITAVIIAGGKGQRLNGLDKGLIQLNGRTIVDQIVEMLSPQVDQLLINANRNLEVYKQFGFPVIEDSTPNYQGPLAGMLTALQSVNTEFIITLPSDGPFLADNYVSRMSQALAESKSAIAIASDGQRMQQMYALIPVNLAEDLTRFMKTGKRAIKDWLALHDTVLVDFSSYPEMFININTKTDLTKLKM